MAQSNFKLSAYDGAFFKKGDVFGVRFERILDHPVEKVWQALIEPEQLGVWLAPVKIEHRDGEGGDSGTITVQMKGGTMGGKILQWRENQVLEYVWHDKSVVRWELLAEGKDRTRLVFTHTNVMESQLHGAATGWHYHMDALTIFLDGVPMPSFPKEAWEDISREAAERYTKMLKGLD